MPLPAPTPPAKEKTTVTPPLLNGSPKTGLKGPKAPPGMQTVKKDNGTSKLPDGSSTKLSRTDAPNTGKTVSAAPAAASPDVSSASSDPDSADAWDDEEEDDVDGSKAAARQAKKAAKKKAKKATKKKARAKADKIKKLKLGGGKSGRMPAKPSGRSPPSVGRKPLLSPALSRAGFKRGSEMGKFFRGNSESALDSKRTGSDSKSGDVNNGDDDDDDDDDLDGGVDITADLAGGVGSSMRGLPSIDENGDEEDFDIDDNDDDDDDDDALFGGSSRKGPRVKARVIVSPKARQRKQIPSDETVDEEDDDDNHKSHSENADEDTAQTSKKKRKKKKTKKKKHDSEEQRRAQRLARRVGPYGRTQTFDIRDYRAKWVEQQAAAHGDFSHAMAPSHATMVQTASLASSFSPSSPPPSLPPHGAGPQGNLQASLVVGRAEEIRNALQAFSEREARTLQMIADKARADKQRDREVRRQRRRAVRRAKMRGEEMHAGGMHGYADSKRNEEQQRLQERLTRLSHAANATEGLKQERARVRQALQSLVAAAQDVGIDVNSPAPQQQRQRQHQHQRLEDAPASPAVLEYEERARSELLRKWAQQFQAGDAGSTLSPVEMLEAMRESGAFEHLRKDGASAALPGARSPPPSARAPPPGARQTPPGAAAPPRRPPPGAAPGAAAPPNLPPPPGAAGGGPRQPPPGAAAPPRRQPPGTAAGSITAVAKEERPAPYVREDENEQGAGAEEWQHQAHSAADDEYAATLAKIEADDTAADQRRRLARTEAAAVAQARREAEDALVYEVRMPSTSPWRADLDVGGTVAAGRRPGREVAFAGVQPGGAAAKAGLRDGDMLLAVAGIPLPSSADGNGPVSLARVCDLVWRAKLQAYAEGHTELTIVVAPGPASLAPSTVGGSERMSDSNETNETNALYGPPKSAPAARSQRSRRRRGQNTFRRLRPRSTHRRTRAPLLHAGVNRVQLSAVTDRPGDERGRARHPWGLVLGVRRRDNNLVVERLLPGCHGRKVGIREGDLLLALVVPTEDGGGDDDDDDAFWTGNGNGGNGSAAVQHCVLNRFGSLKSAKQEIVHARTKAYYADDERGTVEVVVWRTPRPDGEVMVGPATLAKLRLARGPNGNTVLCRVRTGSRADRAGLREGDVLCAVDGVTLAGPSMGTEECEERVQDVAARTHPTSVVPLLVHREGFEREEDDDWR